MLQRDGAGAEEESCGEGAAKTQEQSTLHTARSTLHRTKLFSQDAGKSKGSNSLLSSRLW